MIRVTLYNNGFQIQGHSNPQICGEVSILSWACVCSVEHADPNCWAYLARSDAEKFGRDPNEGLSELVFDTQNPRAAFIFEEFRTNIENWIKSDPKRTGWHPTEIAVERLLENLQRSVPPRTHQSAAVGASHPMPNEPCGDSVCIDRAELEGLRKAADELDRLHARFDESLRQREALITERDEAVAACAGMRATVEKLSGALRARHDYCTGNSKTCLQADIEELVGEALSDDIGASILQRQKEQDAAVAGMRGALSNSLVYIQEYRDVCGDSFEADKTNELNEVISKGNAALSTDSGASTLEYIRGLEADNEAMRGLLKEIQGWLPMNCSRECSTCEYIRCRQYGIYHAIDAYLKGAGKRG